MNSACLLERLARCDREIALAIAESHQQHTAAELAGILLWEMDWLIERENILAEIVQEKAAQRMVGKPQN